MSNPTPIANDYCIITGSFASVSPILGFAFANQQVTFKTDALQNPSCSNFPIAPSEVTVLTDSQGRLPAGFQLQQGAHVSILVGDSSPVSILVPCQSTADIEAIILAQTDPPQVVSAIHLRGPLAAGATAINPDVGQIGESTITFPNTQYETGNGTLAVDCSTGNSHLVTVTGDVLITPSNLQDGQTVIIITAQSNGGGHVITFGAPAGLTLLWSGHGSKPADVTSLATYTLWLFMRVGAALVADFICTAAISSGGSPPPPPSGTVTSIAVTVDSSIFTMTGNPVTVSGTIAAVLKTQTQNLILAGPTGGPAATPTFRPLVPDDIPGLDMGKIVTGVLPVTRGGTGLVDLGLGLLLGNTTGPIALADPGTAGQVMTSFGTGIYPRFEDIPTPAGIRSQFDPTTGTYWSDHFLWASPTLAPPWVNSSPGSFVFQAITSQWANHPGTLRMIANSGDNVAISVASPIWAGSNFDSYIIVLNEVASVTQVGMRCGFFSNPADNPPLDGCYFEKLSSGSNWFFVCRHSGGQALLDTGVSNSLNWVTLRIRRTFPGQLTGNINGGADINLATNLPTLDLSLGIQNIPNVLLGASILVDFVDLKIVY